MIRTIVGWAVVGVLAAASVAAIERDVARLGWLEGCWSGADHGTAMEEHWTSPAGGTLLGMHRDVRDGRTVGFEFPRIVETPERGICYLANPDDRGVTEFCAIALGERRAVFENRGHDFPQRILYWREAGSLHARIEGEEGGRQRAIEWAWMPCAARR